MIDDPEGELASLLARQESPETKIAKGLIQEFADRFQDTHQLELRFQGTAVEKLIEMANADSRSVRELCQERFKDFQFGLKLVAQNTGQRVFELDEAAVEDPEKRLSEWVVASYREEEKPASAGESEAAPDGGSSPAGA